MVSYQSLASGRHDCHLYYYHDLGNYRPLELVGYTSVYCAYEYCDLR